LEIRIERSLRELETIITNYTLMNTTIEKKSIIGKAETYERRICRELAASVSSYFKLNTYLTRRYATKTLHYYHAATAKSSSALFCVKCGNYTMANSVLSNKSVCVCAKHGGTIYANYGYTESYNYVFDCTSYVFDEALECQRDFVYNAEVLVYMILGKKQELMYLINGEKKFWLAYYVENAGWQDNECVDAGYAEEIDIEKAIGYELHMNDNCICNRALSSEGESEGESNEDEGESDEDEDESDEDVTEKVIEIHYCQAAEKDVLHAVKKYEAHSCVSFVLCPMKYLVHNK